MTRETELPMFAKRRKEVYLQQYNSCVAPLLYTDPTAGRVQTVPQRRFLGVAVYF